ncbi:fucolectin-3-like [Haliotis rufescens]|uniref:fucolectin-3-like n=1 Tax=Haliotis rufescens TaxID=6454 RepID=UPI00201F3B6A|nr:fucolectin-3-like [Haliotis rufescens]
MVATDDDVSTCSLTGSETGDAPWWQMDLNEAVTVLSVEITNRNDDKYKWLSNIQIDLYDQLPSSCSGDTEVTPRKCTSREEQVGRGEAVTLTCDTPTTGRYVRITKKVKLPDEALSLCEVTVTTLPST